MERDKPNGIAGKKFIISTHTLTWSVTKDCEKKYFLSKISTHTLTWSVTISDTILSALNAFQLTRSRGA